MAFIVLAMQVGCVNWIKTIAIATNILSYSMIILQRERTSAEAILYAL